MLSMSKNKEYTDSQIVEGIQRKDRTIEEFLFHRCKKYFDQNYGSIFVMDKTLKDDIFQETYVKLWNDIEGYRIHIGNDGNVWRTDKFGIDRPMTSHLHTFLMDIAKNVYRVWMRKPGEVLIDDIFPSSGYSGEEDNSYLDKISTTDSPWDNGDHVATSEADSFDQALSDDDQRGIIIDIVQTAIMNLSNTCRDILTKFYCEGMSLDEILASRNENTSKDGLKTGKSKCLKRFETDVKNMFEKYHIKY